MTAPLVCRSLTIAAALCALAAAQAQPRPAVMTDVRVVRAHLERLAAPDLQALYLRCDAEATQRVLDFDEAARCSIVAEVLLQRSFGGDLDALLAWWRVHRLARP